MSPQCNPLCILPLPWPYLLHSSTPWHIVPHVCNEVITKMTTRKTSESRTIQDCKLLSFTFLVMADMAPALLKKSSNSLCAGKQDKSKSLTSRSTTTILFCTWKGGDEFFPLLYCVGREVGKSIIDGLEGGYCLLFISRHQDFLRHKCTMNHVCVQLKRAPFWVGPLMVQWALPFLLRKRVFLEWVKGSFSFSLFWGLFSDRSPFFLFKGDFDICMGMFVHIGRRKIIITAYPLYYGDQ